MSVRIESLDLASRVGQLLVPALSGREGGPTDRDPGLLDHFLIRCHAGGLLLFDADVLSTPSFLNYAHLRSPVPVLVASDLEEGVGRQVAGATRFPPPMALGATGSEELAFRVGRAVGGEARTVGIHMVLAPVCDLPRRLENPIVGARAFATDPDLAARLASAYVRGVQSAGAAACAKHFPGHGETDIDSHTSLPRIGTSEESWERREATVFRAAVQADVAAVMSGHLLFEALDAVHPASLSSVVLEDILRRRFDFGGLIMTDALTMGALAEIEPPGESAVLAFLAGNDLLLYPRDPEAAFVALVRAVEEGRISSERLDASVGRILAFKEQYRVEPLPAEAFSRIPEFVGIPDHIALAEEVARRGLTALSSLDAEAGRPFPMPAVVVVLRDDARVAPPAKLLEVLPESGSPLLVDYDRDIPSVGIPPPDRPLLVVLAGKAHAGKGRIGLRPDRAEFVRRLLADRRAPTRVIVLGPPHLGLPFRDSVPVLCAYGDSEPCRRAVAEHLRTGCAPPGRLPVEFAAP